MAWNNYHLVSHWRVTGSVNEVANILADARALPDWWGSVYQEVELLEDGDVTGVGKLFRVRARGWLPYELRLTFRETEQRYPYGFSVAVSGDLNGRGVWTLSQDGGAVTINFDWTVSADKAILRWFSPLLKPLFVSNHRWTMRRGEEALQLELERRHAGTPEQRSLVPLPPEPFHYSPAMLMLGAVAAISIGSAAFGVVQGLRRRS
jgi:hypothetical protein